MLQLEVSNPSESQLVIMRNKSVSLSTPCTVIKDGKSSVIYRCLIADSIKDQLDGDNVKLLERIVIKYGT